MNATYSAVIVGACKALFAGYNTAPAIARLLNAPGEPDSQARRDLKWLFAANSYRDDPQATDSAVETKLRSYVGLSSGGETIRVSFGAGPNVYSVS